MCPAPVRGAPFFSLWSDPTELASGGTTFGFDTVGAGAGSSSAMYLRGLTLVAVLGLAVGACTDEPPIDTLEQGISVSPTSWSFGTATVGTEVGPRAVTVSYGVGFGSDEVVSITSCPDFRVDLGGAGLPYSVYRICESGQLACQFIDTQTLTFYVYFRPSIPNVESCNLVIDYESSPTSTIALSGTGVPPPIDITVVQPSTNTLDFGDVIVNQTSTPRTITIRSDGGAALDVTGAAANGAGFASSGTVPIALSPGATADYTVTCAPTSPGLITGTFRITSSDPDEGIVDVVLRCNGIQSALAISPSPATLPITRVGESSDVPITLTNSGTAGLALENVTISGDAFTITMPPGATSLAPSASTDLRIGFNPTADGDVTGTLTVSYDGGQTRQVAITGPGRMATLQVTPSGSIDFGPICVGQSDSEIVVALDAGTGEFVVEDITASGEGFNVTPISPTTYPAPLAPLGVDTITFQASVTPLVEGELAGAVTIATDIPGRAAEVIALHANAFAGGTTATPSELDTGATVVGSGAGGRLISLSNCETEPLTIVSVGIEGVDALDFAIVTSPVTSDIAPGSNAAWLVELRPTTPGAKTATFHIVHSRGTADVLLTGDGLDESGELGGDPRGSYYACSARDARGGGGALAIALAVLLMARRRTRSRRVASRASR
jgi:hypothetical protein